MLQIQYFYWPIVGDPQILKWLPVHFFFHASFFMGVVAVSRRRCNNDLRYRLANIVNPTLVDLRCK